MPSHFATSTESSSRIFVEAYPGKLPALGTMDNRAVGSTSQYKAIPGRVLSSMALGTIHARLFAHMDQAIHSTWWRG